MWGLSPGPHIAGGMGQVGSRAIALGPIGQHELHSGHQKSCMSHRLMVWQVIHSSTKDEGSPSCASTASKSCMSHKLIVAGHSSTKHEGPPHIKTLIEMSAGSCFLHAYVHIRSKHILCHINTMRIILIVTCLGFSMSILA